MTLSFPENWTCRDADTEAGEGGVKDKWGALKLPSCSCSFNLNTAIYGWRVDLWAI